MGWPGTGVELRVGMPGRGACCCTCPGAGRVCCCCKRATMSGRGGTTGRAAGCPARFGRGCGRNGVPGVGEASGRSTLRSEPDGKGAGGAATGHRLGRKRDRRRRHGRSGSGRRQGLPRSRQDLSGARRRNGARGNGTGAQRGMQRRCATGGQWRPQRRRLAAKRFFNCRRADGGGNGGLLRGPSR